MPRITLYFPDEPYRKVKKLAKKERRSLSSQIVYIVEQYIERIENEFKQGKHHNSSTV